MTILTASGCQSSYLLSDSLDWQGEDFAFSLLILNEIMLPGCWRLLLCSTQPQTPSTLHLESESEEILLSGVAEIQRFKLALRVASVYVWRFLFYKN